MEYREMVIEASEARLVSKDKSWVGSFKVRVFASPAGEMKPEEAIPVEYDDDDLQLRLSQLENRALDRADLIALGRTLAVMLFPPNTLGTGKSGRDFLAESLNLLGPDRGLRLRLRLPLQLAALPWEYMYVDRAGGGEGMDGFLALDPQVAIVRHEPLPTSSDPPLATGDIKVVAALASPRREGLPVLDLTKEKAYLEQALSQQQGIITVFLEKATLAEILPAMPHTQIFHFAGHGVFDRQMASVPGTYSGTGSLALEDQSVEAEQLGINLRGNGVRLAVLGGCETGRRDNISTWSGIAQPWSKRKFLPSSPTSIASGTYALLSSAVCSTRHWQVGCRSSGR